jgi:hypothetical protein
MLRLNMVSQAIYVEHFDAIFDWFHHNVHTAWESYHYSILSVDKTFLKLIDLSTDQNFLHFRVLLKATYDDVNQLGVPAVDPREISWIQKAKTDKEHGNVEGWQVCFVQLDSNNAPIAGVLFTFSGDKFHRFEVGKQEK